MHPLKSKRQYSDRPPYTLGHSLGWRLDFHDLLIKQLGEEGTEPRIELRRKPAACLGCLNRHIASMWIHRLGNGRVSAAYCRMVGIKTPEDRKAMGHKNFDRRRRVLWLLDNSASLHALIKGPRAAFFVIGQSSCLHVAYWFKVHVWFEFVDTNPTTQMDQPRLDLGHLLPVHSGPTESKIGWGE